MRRLIYSDDFANQLTDLERHVPRLRAILKGVALKLTANPEYGEQVRFDPSVWFVPLPDTTARAIGISYCFNDEIVELLSVWIS